jgi:hypothetical protein
MLSFGFLSVQRGPSPRAMGCRPLCASTS